MSVIGLTGPTGGGKSTVSAVASEMGFAVIDCDRVARGVVENDRRVLNGLCEAFGEDILDACGRLDRKRLAERAFAGPAETEKLNSVTLPAVSEAVLKEINALKSAGRTNILLDAPTLYESGLDRVCDAVAAVLCGREERERRVILRDKLTEAQAQTRLSASKPDGFYTGKTEHIIYNNGSLEQFRENAARLLKRLAVPNEKIS